MAINTAGLRFPKGRTRKQIKGRQRRAERKVVQSVRAQVIERAKGCCERCGYAVFENGHAHHRTPRSRGGKWTVANIQYLCCFCHALAHRTGRL